MDPDFRIDEFLKEMEEYMIPVVVEAFLKPDMDLIRAVCAGEVRGVYRTVLPVCVWSCSSHVFILWARV